MKLLFRLEYKKKRTIVQLQRHCKYYYCLTEPDKFYIAPQLGSFGVTVHKARTAGTDKASPRGNVQENLQYSGERGNIRSYVSITLFIGLIFPGKCIKIYRVRGSYC